MGILSDFFIPGVRLWLSMLTLAAVMGALWYGGLDIIQHYALRFLLYRLEKVPFKWGEFLDYAEAHIFLRKVGGSYIFIHRTLLEHFAERQPQGELVGAVPMNLETGQSVTVTIDANKPWNQTGVWLEAGQCYQFRAEGRWKDGRWTNEAAYSCGPAGYPSRNFLQRMSERYRRVPDEDWFTLFGAFDGQMQHAFKLGEQLTTTMAQSGLLTCFANDSRLMYWNNSGSVELTIRRLPPEGCSEPG